ncbi:hypothetical protein HHK36_029683 [Tetracentron sinense]|uniref:Seed maturation-like protein n=1 Tax=Tetracentron sinense TaxID=13715 RepID=A0A834YC42_TETSI|nr:hypothetical protein HHK36_029683 [Tetracentron sinense]
MANSTITSASAPPPQPQRIPSPTIPANPCIRCQKPWNFPLPPSQICSLRFYLSYAAFRSNYDPESFTSRYTYRHLNLGEMNSELVDLGMASINFKKSPNSELMDLRMLRKVRKGKERKKRERARAQALMAAAARALFLSLKPPQPPPLFSRHLLIRPLLPAKTKSRSSSPCLVSGVDGGGVADDFVSIRKSDFDRGFSVIANMLNRIEILDTSVISKGVSISARDSMKQTISTMLGLLPSDQFSVSIRVSRRPLDRLIVSSIITGYTLWNADYRVSLMRNLDISPECTETSVSSEGCEISEAECDEREGGDGEVGVDGCSKYVMERGLGDLSSEALSYTQKLELELATIEKELNAQKQENMHMEYNREENNDLLKYLRSLGPDMVTELSRPSSSEVEEIIHQLVQNILQKFFKDDTASDFLEDSVIGRTVTYPDRDNDLYNTVTTSRDYLAKLLFWCMLLGHHLRGLENRLHLSCVVGLL